MGHIPPEGAHLIGSLMGVALYGLYIHLTTYVLLHMKRGRIRSRVVTGILATIWILTTFANALKISITYDAFILWDASAGTFYVKQYGRGYSVILRPVAYINGVFAQFLMCWRMYMVWNRNRKMLIIPAVLLTGAVVSVCMNFVYVVKSGAAARAYSKMAVHWQFSVLALTLVNDIIVTALICWKIWRVVNDVSDDSTDSSRVYWHLIHVMIESGMLYTISLLSCFVVKLIELEITGIMFANIMPSVTGILPTLVILRLLSSSEKPERTTKNWSVQSVHPSRGVNSQIYSSMESGIPLENISRLNTPLGDQSQSKDGSTITRVHTNEGLVRLHADVRLGLVNGESIPA